MARQLLDDAGIPVHICGDAGGGMQPELGQVGGRHGITLVVHDEHRDEAHGFLAQVAAAPEDWEEPDRSRGGIRVAAAGMLITTFGIGLLVQLAMTVSRWL
jgi:hypothetical protein